MNLRETIEHAINCNNAENGSNTPDFMLAEFLTDCLAAFDRAVVARERWYGRDPGIGPAGMRTDGVPVVLDTDPIDPDPNA